MWRSWISENSSIGSLHFCSFCSRLDSVWNYFARITKSMTKQACFAQWTQETWHGSWCLQAISCFFALAFDSGVASLGAVLQAKQKGLKRLEISRDPEGSESSKDHPIFLALSILSSLWIQANTTWSRGLEPYCLFRSILLFGKSITIEWNVTGNTTSQPKRYLGMTQLRTSLQLHSINCKPWGVWSVFVGWGA